MVFINKEPIHWYINNQPSVEKNTFSADLYAMKVLVEMVETLRYKLSILGVPLDGAANVIYDNEAVYKNTVIPDSTFRNKHHSIAYHKCQEVVTAKKNRVVKQETLKNLAYLFTKVLTVDRRRFLLDRFM